jgi:hypothetical protein
MHHPFLVPADVFFFLGEGAEDDFFFWLLADFLVRSLCEITLATRYTYRYQGVRFPQGCSHIFGIMSYMDTSQMTSLDRIDFTEEFNEDISRWDVSNVEDMSFLFYDLRMFNQPLETWNVGKVRSMWSMFELAEAFNQPLGKWNVSNVQDFTSMFDQTKSFNQSLREWNLPDNYLHIMFRDATGYNQDCRCGLN